MVSVDELRKIYLVQNLSDEQLESLGSILERRFLEEKEVIFEQNQQADNFYMLKRGKVLLRVDISASTTISLGAVKPGYSFGWSSLLGDNAYTSHAVCVEPSELFVAPGAKFMELLDQDHTMGYLVMQGVVRILENRLRRRTEQLLKTMRKQMEIWDLW